MDRRARASSATSKGLLSRQLASIADTLAKASQRRDAEVRKARRPSRVPVVQTDMTLASGCDCGDIEDNARAMLAELGSLGDIQGMSEAQSDSESDDDLKRILLELHRPVSPPRTATAVEEDDDPKRILAELAAFSTSDFRKDITCNNDDYDDDDDIDMLRIRLENLQRQLDDTPQTTPARTDPSSTVTEDTLNEFAESSVHTLNAELVPYVVALRLEHSNCQWEQAQGWTTFLYSSGVDGYEAQQQREVAVLHAEEALKRVIDNVMEVEERFRQKEETTKPQRCLIVSNLAAAADEEELQRQFWQHQYQIVEVTFLPERDPLKGTRTAHIVMSSREAAIQASYTSGNVYGLLFDVKLAGEHTN